MFNCISYKTKLNTRAIKIEHKTETENQKVQHKRYSLHNLFTWTTNYIERVLNLDFLMYIMFLHFFSFVLFFRAAEFFLFILVSSRWARSICRSGEKHVRSLQELLGNSNETTKWNDTTQKRNPKRNAVMKRDVWQGTFAVSHWERYKEKQRERNWGSENAEQTIQESNWNEIKRDPNVSKKNWLWSTS